MHYTTVQQRLAKTFVDSNYDRVAIDYADKRITYGQLNTVASYIAHKLNECKASRGSHIGVYTEDKSLMVAAAVSILRMGMVFIPLDSSYPLNHLSLLCGIADITYVITDANDNQELSEQFNKAELISVSSQVFYDDQLNFSFPLDLNCADDPAYIYFTSGTTGQPKAIYGRNSGLAHFIKWEISRFNISQNIRVSQLTPPGHDPFLRDIFVPLFVGGTICIPKDREIILSLPRLADWLDESDVNIIHCTPSVFFALCQAQLHSDKFLNLRYIFLGGERLFAKPLKKWYATFGDRVILVNLYGPTETTLAKLYHVVTCQDLANEQIPIGKPIDDTEVFLLNADGEQCKSGEVGEIYIQTEFRSLGYYKRDDLSKELFLPAARMNDGVVYRTGDLAKKLQDGSIIFLGRHDDQYKIRGHRINLGEVETTIIGHSDIENCVVRIQNPGSMNERLIAYYIPLSNITEDELKTFMLSKVPDYMLPSVFVPIQSFPMTNNGKIDGDALDSERILAIEKHSEHAQPDDLSTKLISIWKEILDRQEVTKDDVFMNIGGDSLSMMLLIARLNSDYNYDLTLWQIFDDLTIEKLATYIKDSDNQY